MELKLNIYEKREIVKTYTAETYELMFGTVEDLINTLDLENVDLDDKSSMLQLVSRMVMNGLDIIKPLLKDIFEGLTDEELRHTKVNDIAMVMIEVVKFAVIEMSKGATGKN